MTNKRELYGVVIRYKQPLEGSLQIAAFDEDHAKALVQKMMPEKEGLEIIDIFNMKELEHVIPISGPPLVKDPNSEDIEFEDIDVTATKVLN